MTPVVERDGRWFIATCPEVPGANGQGRTREDALASLAMAVELILEDRREEAMRDKESRSSAVAPQRSE